jgi:hypothetical protein
MKKLLLLAMLLYPALAETQSTPRSPMLPKQAIFKLLVDGDALLPPLTLSLASTKGGQPSIYKYTPSDTPSGFFTMPVGFPEESPQIGVDLREGDYRVAVTGLPENYRVKSMTTGLVDLLRFPLTLAARGVSARC